MITREKSYTLGDRYEKSKKKISDLLTDYIDELYLFDDNQEKITFKTETLIPSCDPAKANILLLFSNPHPGSVKTGMFLCTRKHNPSRFWWFMRDAGWFNILNIDYVSENLKKIFLDGLHEGPFNLFFDCFYDFPTEDPKDLVKIFGKEFFHQEIQQTAKSKIADTVRAHKIDAIVSFNGQVTALLTGRNLKGYIRKLNNGELLKFIYSGDDNTVLDVPMYQSYPTGFHYVEDITKKRHHNLTRIREDIVLDTISKNAAKTEGVMISEPSVLFRIGKYFSPDLSPVELYDVTRGRWKMGRNREKAHLAFAIYKHIIIEVYEIAQWFPAGTTLSARLDPPPPDRWEFVGNIAPPQMRDKYINKSVEHYFRAGARTVFRYINI